LEICYHIVTSHIPPRNQVLAQPSALCQADPAGRFDSLWGWEYFNRSEIRDIPSGTQAMAIGKGIQSLNGTFKNSFSFFGRDVAKRITISALIGVVSGLGAMAFFVGLEWLRWFCLGYLAGAPAPAPEGEQLVHLAVSTPYRPWLLFLIPAIGGLLSGLLVYTWAPEAEGHGTDAMIDAFHNKGGFIRTVVPYIKSLASIITLSTGGSAGREGPIAQIGAGFGSWVGRILKLDVRERRVFLLAGCAAGLGAIFRAPLGAAITSVEVLYREDFESEAIIPCVISSVLAYSMFTFVFGFEPLFGGTSGFGFRDPKELIFYGVLGLICAPIGGFYVKFFYKVRDLFKGLSLPRILRPALGGLGVGLIALAVPQAIGGGYGYLQMAIYGQLGLGIMCLAAAAKIVTTSLTIGSGGSGGVFGPTLFIGGMLGGLVGQLGHMWFPEIVTQPGAYVLVGMAAFFAGSAKAPLGALLMVSEMTWSYGLLPPLMLVSVIAILFNRHSSIYEKQLKNKFASPAHKGELTVNVLSELKVSDVMEPGQKIYSLKPDSSFAFFQQVYGMCKQSVFPVLEGNRLAGLLSVRSVRPILLEESVGELLVCGELCGEPAQVGPDQDLYHALLRFLDTGYTELPIVVYRNDRIEVIGLLKHEDVISAYHKEVMLRSQDSD
jgi:CIC family chloride channel protein